MVRDVPFFCLPRQFWVKHLYTLFLSMLKISSLILL